MENEQPLQLAMDIIHGDDNRWPIEWMIFNVLNDYLQPNSKLAVDEAARFLDALLPENRPDLLKDGIESVTGWLRELFDLFWGIAKQIHYEHHGQDKLIALLQELKRLPITQAVVCFPGVQLAAWAEFGQCDARCEIWLALKAPVKSYNPSKQICDQYINASAFAARFFNAALQSAFFTHGPTRCIGRGIALKAIKAAVETKIPNDELLSCHYIAAAQWILLASEWLFSDIRWGQAYYPDCEVTEVEAQYPSFEPPRWVR